MSVTHPEYLHVVKIYHVAGRNGMLHNYQFINGLIFGVPHVFQNSCQDQMACLSNIYTPFHSCMEFSNICQKFCRHPYMTVTKMSAFNYCLFLRVTLYVYRRNQSVYWVSDIFSSIEGSVNFLRCSKICFWCFLWDQKHFNRFNNGIFKSWKISQSSALGRCSCKGFLLEIKEKSFSSRAISVWLDHHHSNWA